MADAGTTGEAGARRFGGFAAPRVWEVAALVQAVADALTARFAVAAVRGEVSGFTRASSGHCYFVVKDVRGTAALRCVMFRRAAALLTFDPEDGGTVEIRGRLTVYEARGELQLVVESMQRAGEGLLLERFLRLKLELEREGLFAPERKRPIASYPSCVAVISSTAGAALHDVLTALQRRAPHVKVLVYPSLVQGAEAPSAIAAALGAVARDGLAQTILLVRGGGSLEDLWAFNDPLVVRSMAASPIPIISGVGHETDTTLADFVADLRAPTPTAAAELAAVPRAEALSAVDRLAAGLVRSVRDRLDRQAQRLDRASMRMARPGHRVDAQRQRLNLLQQAQVRAASTCFRQQRERQLVLAQRLQRASAAHAARSAHRLDVLVARLGALDPANVLSRGYAWLSDEAGRTLTSVHQLAPGQALEARLVDGRAAVQVLSTQADPAASDDAALR